MYEWGYCFYKSPPSCGISERNNCGSSPGHLLGENPVCVYILVHLAGAWLPVSQTLVSWAEHLLLAASRWQQWVIDVSVGRLSWWTPTEVPEPTGVPSTRNPIRDVPWDPRAVASLQESQERGVSSQPPRESILQFTGSRNPYLTAQESNETHLKIWTSQALRLHQFTPADLPLLFQSVWSAQFLLIRLFFFSAYLSAS